MSSPSPGEHGDWHAVKDALADRSTTFYIVPNAFVLAGLIAAAAVFLRSRTEPPEAFGFAVLLIPGVGLQALLAAYPRMLVPLVPLMLWFIVQAAVTRKWT